MSFSPGLWPRERIRPARSHAELAVYDALATGLPSGWSAWHSLRLRDAGARLGEGDFVLAHPQRGALILEVKGGQISQRDGRWFSYEEPLKRAPLDQALDFATLLRRRLAKSSCQAPAVGAAVCFPDTAFDRDPGEDVLRGVVLGKAQLAWLGHALPGLLDRALPPAGDAVGDWVRAIHALWGESWVPGLSLGMQVKELGDQRFSLSEQQLEALEGLADNPRVLVQGGAGSGKTLMAAEAARREASAGRRVLLLCFTQPLQRWLAARLEGEGVEVKTVSSLAWAFASAAGTSETTSADTTDPEQWRANFLRAGELAEPRWDAVIVDEAQDFQEEAWLFVSGLLAPATRFWAFHDPGQGFWPDRHPPDELFRGATRYRLTRGRRCPPGIHALANRWAGEPHDAAAIQAAFASRTLAFVESPSATALHDKVGAEVDRLLSDGLAPGDIAIVSLRGQSADAIFNAPRIGRHAFARAHAPDMQERLVADSFLRWKGLERPAVVVADLPAGADPKQLPVRMYVALTRALTCVRLVGLKEHAARFGA